jgi:3-oxoacyl-[acyl-carrier-protein] synthase-3
MAYFSIPKVSLRGISATVPKHKVSNLNLEGFEDEELKKLIATIGIENRRVAATDQCASDLCIDAANNLIKELNWNREEIQVLFFVSQTPDFNLPGSSMYLQDRLALPKSCASFDINQGCAGYVYGLSLITAFMSASGLKKGLLLVGDTITKLISPFDKSLLPIFSDCGTATAIELNDEAESLKFNLSTEGEGYESIIVPHGGARHPLKEESFIYQEKEGINKRKGIHLQMKGLDVFNFSLKKVVPNTEELLQKSQLSTNEIDYFVFHQANQLILDSISKKLGISSEKVPSSLKNFGNTSGATIPLTIVTKLSKENMITDSKMVLCGFGVGLSLASAIVDFKNVTCLPVSEI